MDFGPFQHGFGKPVAEVQGLRHGHVFRRGPDQKEQEGDPLQQDQIKNEARCTSPKSGPVVDRDGLEFRGRAFPDGLIRK